MSESPSNVPNSELQSTSDLQKADHPRAEHAGRAGRKRIWLFAVGTVLIVLPFLPALGQLLELTSQEPHYSHIVLVPFVSLYFFWIQRSSIFSSYGGGLVVGGSLCASGLLLLAVRSWLWQDLNHNDWVSLTIFCLLLIWSGLLASIFGADSLRRAAFPLLFLLFMAPIPSRLLDEVVGFLQAGSTEVAHRLLQFSGTPVFRSGEFFQLPGLNIRVAPECSGIRSSLALFLTALVAGRLYLLSRFNRLLLAVAAIPITVFKNGLRIATLCLLTIHVDPRFIGGELHTRGGYPFFLLALAFLTPVLWVLRRREKGRQTHGRKYGRNQESGIRNQEEGRRERGENRRERGAER